MFERPGSDSQAVLVSLDFGEPDYAESTDELAQLALSARINIAGILRGRRARPDPEFFAGSGKVEELADLLAQTEARDSPSSITSCRRHRNAISKKKLNCRVIDRISLILDIFAQRAHSHEGKLQVELAQLEHLSTRLVRGWTHLERQNGGIGLRGPGETQLETDRRLLGKRVKVLKDKLARLASQREVQRRGAAPRNMLSVSLVGYTNAGKSTLFNALTRGTGVCRGQVFRHARYDDAARIPAPMRRPVVVSDTVGFIRQLPHTLVAAFARRSKRRSSADLLLHVVDAAARRATRRSPR